MSASRDPDRLIRAFLQEGEDQLFDPIYDTVRAEIEHKRQRAAFGPWRTFSMNRIVGYSLAAAAVVVAGLFLSSRLFGPPDGNGTGGGPTPTPKATATPHAGLPEGPYEFAWEGFSNRAPRITVTIAASDWTSTDPGAVQKGDEEGNVPEAALLPFSEPAGSEFYVYGNPCRWESTKPETPATTVDEIVAALADQKSRDASEPVNVTVGGYAGKAITLHVPDDANFDQCEGAEFASFGVREDDLARYHQGPGQIDELWIIDVEGAVVVLDAMYRPNTPAALIEEMRSMAESATFELP